MSRFIFEKYLPHSQHFHSQNIRYWVFFHTFAKITLTVNSMTFCVPDLELFQVFTSAFGIQMKNADFMGFVQGYGEKF